MTNMVTGLAALSGPAFDVTFISTAIINATSFHQGGFCFRLSTVRAFSPADLDLDGKPHDLAIPNTNGVRTFSILHNNGVNGSINASSFNSGVAFQTGNTTASSQLIDVDGDRKKKILSRQTMGKNTFSVLLNTGNPGSISASSFAARVSFATGTGPFGVAVNDIDMDGKPDVIVVNNGSNNISVFQKHFHSEIYRSVQK